MLRRRDWVFWTLWTLLAAALAWRVVLLAR
jgi:hypothetical protein